MNRKELKNKKICFYYPHTQKISGGLFFFYTLADYISKKYNHDVYIINKKDAYFTKYFLENNPDTKIKFIDYENVYNTLDNNTIFFAYLNMLPLIAESFYEQKKAKILLIDFHSFSHIYLFNNIGIHTNKLKNKFMTLLHSKNSLTLMDKSCVDTLQEFIDSPVNETYIPVFLKKTYEEYTNDKLVDENKINVACVCRLDADKIYTTINWLDNLYNLNFNKPIRVHIIGDGNCKHLININKYKEKLEIIMTSYMYGEELREYLKNNIDLAFNFGVAALDMAAQKLPVAIPVFEQKPHNINKYYFLYNAKDYILGCREDLLDKYDIKTQTIEEIINKVYTNNNKEKIGKKCFNYLVQNHMIEKSAKLFLEHIQKTTLTIEDCLNFPPFNKSVKKYKKARKRGFDWDFHMVNQLPSRVFLLRSKLAFYGFKLLLCPIPIIKDHINLNKTKNKINQIVNILANRKK